jgi:hypothetical protein
MLTPICFENALRMLLLLAAAAAAWSAGAPVHVDSHLLHEPVVRLVAVGVVNRNLACAASLDLTLWWRAAAANMPAVLNQTQERALKPDELPLAPQTGELAVFNFQGLFLIQPACV